MFQPTFNTALRTKRIITNAKIFSDECLFQIIRMEREARIKITTHAVTIIVFDGVQSGRFIVLYQSLPVSAKYDAAEEVIMTNKGIKK